MSCNSEYSDILNSIKKLCIHSSKLYFDEMFSQISSIMLLKQLGQLLISMLAHLVTGVCACGVIVVSQHFTVIAACFVM